jgi:hypothetical protein
MIHAQRRALARRKVLLQLASDPLLGHSGYGAPYLPALDSRSFMVPA